MCSFNFISAELGDYDDVEHTPGVISEFRFVPEEVQSEAMELAILDKFKACKSVVTSLAHY